MHWKSRGWTLIGMLLLAIPGVVSVMRVTAAAQVTGAPATTQVTDTIYRADGTPANGTVIVSWQAFTTASGQAVPSGTASATIVSGALSLQLVPDAGSTPMGTYYTAVYHLDDGTTSREFWVVPVSQTPVLVSAIRSSVLPTSVAMQTVSKSYVDTAIAAAVSGHPLDSSPYVLKAGDTMTGPLVLPGDPTTTNQAADKHYVDVNIAATTGGLGQKVSLLPFGTQVVTQPAGTQLQVNLLNGEEYASQYATGSAGNGIANAVASPDCVSGCDVKVERTYIAPENYQASTWNSGSGGTHVEDRRNGQLRDTYLNPTSSATPGQDGGQVIDVTSTRSSAAEFASEGVQEPGSFALSIRHAGLTGGSNIFPQGLENVPYFKTNYTAMTVNGTYNTMGQHLLDAQGINCYGVGDCLIGSQFILASGGFRDEADEGAHPFDLQIREDSAVFQGTCSAGCTTGSTSVMIAPTAAAGTQGEGRFLIDKNPAKIITAGLLTGASSGAPGAGAVFSGTNFPVSVFLSAGQPITSQANNMAPGTVTVAIATTGVAAGIATNTAAVPSSTGVACISDLPNGGLPHNYEMSAYTVVDGTHLQMTLNKPHVSGATIAFGGLCGYGLEQTVDTMNGIRQVFPVIGSYSPTGLYYASTLTSIVGVQGNTSAYLNFNVTVAAISRMNNVVTVTSTGNFPVDLNGLTMTVSGVADQSYNGTFAVTSTSVNTLTYAQAGPNSTSSGGTVGYLTGGYVLYPMAEVLGVFDTAAKSVDGQLTLAANTVPWGMNDPVEEPHYFQLRVSGDITYVGQSMPRPEITQTAGIQYETNVGPGVNGWTVLNAVPAANYLGNGGNHSVPHIAYAESGIWQRTMDMQAGEQSVFSIHCNSHGCGKWDSGYNLFEFDSNAGVDTESYLPQSNMLQMNLHGSIYQFTPQAFTAGTINAETINATTLNGQLNASQLPLVVGSGAGHSAGAVPDPGPTAGTTRYLREDGTWAAVSGSGGSATNQISANLLVRYALTDGTGAPQDSSGNGNNATLPGGSANPTWTSQGISCNGTSQYFSSVGTKGSRTFVWSSTETPPLNSALPAGPQYVTAFGVPDLSLVEGGSNYYGSHPAVAHNGSYNGQSNGTLEGTHTFALTLGAGGADVDHFYVDGVETTYLTGAWSSASFATAAYQVCGVNSGYPTFFPGSFYYFETFSDEKSATQIAQESNAVTQIVQSRGVSFKSVPDPTIKDLYLAVGDSLTNGEGVNSSSQFIAPSDTFDVVNDGLGNADTDDLFELFDAREAMLVRHNAGRNVLRLWVGTNDVSTRGRTAQQALDGIRAYCRKARAAGFQTIVSDMISRAGNDTNMIALDTLMTTQDTGCDLVLDLASNPLLGAVGASANTTYYQSDGTHLQQVGQQSVVAPAETRAINLLEHLKSSNTSPTVTSATYAMADYDLYLPVSPAGNSVAATLPDCSYFTGLTRSIKNLQGAGANTVTVAPAAGQLIDGSGSAITVANGATLVLRQIVPNRTTAGCMWVKVSNN